MTSYSIEFWLIIQMIIEVLLCCIMGCYIYREKGKKAEVRQEQEKIKILMGSLQSFIAKSEDLDEKHQKVLKLWEKIEKRGEAIETYIDHYERELKSFPEREKAGEESDNSVESSVSCYEKTSHLIEKGLSAEKIAQTVGLPKGEVELMMNLKRQ